MNLSFQEKSIWGSLIITLLAFGYYFVTVLEMWSQGTAGAADVTGLIVGVIVAVVVVEIVYHILISIRPTPDPEDERDRLIEGKATRVAYFLLVCGALTAIGHGIATHGTAEGWRSSVDGALSPFITAHILLFSFVLAEVVKFCTQLYYYRAGV